MPRVMVVDNITWNEIMLVGFFIIFIVVLVALFYIIKLLISINKTASVVQGILEKNKKNIDLALDDVPKITKGLADWSEAAKNQIPIVSEVIKDVNRTTKVAANLADVFKDNVVSRVRNIYDIIYLLIKVFQNSDQE